MSSLNYYENIVINICKSTDKSFTFCRQIKEIEKLITEIVSKITFEKIYKLKLNILVTALFKDLGCYTHEEIKKWRENPLEDEGI